jgi:hypothetical protein
MEQPRNDALEGFERELRQRFPLPWPIKQYVLPKQVTECAEIFVRELKSRDVIAAAEMADALMTTMQKSSQKLSREAEERECIRIAIVGLGARLEDGTVAYRHVNNTGAPLAEINDWGKRVWDALAMYYNDVNGLPAEEFFEGLRGARTVGVSAPRTDGIPANASPGRLAG